MSRISGYIAIALLGCIVCLLLLSALNILPHTNLVRVCPVDAISMQDGKATIDRDKCIGCKRCVLGVPGILVKQTPAETPVAIPAIVDNSIQNNESSENQATVDESKTQTKKENKNSPAKDKAVVDPRGKAYIVDHPTCVGCGLCVANCPVQAITMVDGKAVIDPKKCIRCGICKNGNGADFSGCPVTAISQPK
jgi:Na+-translocating ferredoxin:NAD+ oxidoreductase subunit B